MADTVADVLVRLGVDTNGLREGFRDARNQTVRFASDLAHLLSASLRGGPIEILGTAARTASRVIPGPFGTLLGGLGNIFSAIGRFFSGLFKRSARNAAREIRLAFQEIVTAFNSGSATLGATLQRLEQERARAIRRLSGKKGGREELNRLLPEFDRAIAELRSRQQAILEQFESSLQLLRVGRAFRDVAASVQELLQQYRTYVDAGGDLARANEFLSRSLEELRADARLELAEGEQQAIENALRLNQLLLEREAILAEAAEQEQKIRTRGVLERQRTVAQEKALELEAVRRRRDERLAELDREIQHLQLRVDIETKVFELSRDRVALELRLLELKAQEAEREATRLAALKQVVAGIVPSFTGLTTLTPTLQQILNLGGISIIVGQDATPAQARRLGAEAIEGMLRALLEERARLGLHLAL
ncbi:MAG: hypothetical protein K6U02_01135 [Firmicutes bacterium]|nr:hypothetical protein [Bacillota bacterium]